jgi:hypothetical protein
MPAKPEQTPNCAALTKEGMNITEGLALQAAEDGGIEALRKNIQQLMDIEAIKQLKHAYFRCIDTANLEELHGLLHPDIAVNFIGGSYTWNLQGRQAYVDAVAKAFNQQSVGHHNGHSPEIQLLSDHEATAIWYLADHMWVLNYQHLTTGSALYRDRYVKVDGRWLIRETQYQRLYEINQSLAQNPQLAAHYLAVHGAPVAP